jgi:chemotaxis protein methyltransferase CheR
MIDSKIKKIEMDLLIKAVKDRYGYDFENYSRASMYRRMTALQTELGLYTLSQLIYPVLHDREIFEKLLYKMSVTVTEMFRDPEVFLSLRKEIIPYLDTFPFIRIWLAGCATGEEAYSLAILLAEEGVYDRCQIYATDFNDTALKSARNGIYKPDVIKKYMNNYRRSGGQASLSEYFHSDYDSVIINSNLKENITFANHNLAIDQSFSEVNLILCRNVLIYFNQSLQNRVLQLFRESLLPNGFLCLGTRESLRFSPVVSDFVPIRKELNIYKRIIR